MKLIPILLIALLLTGCAVADAESCAPIEPTPAAVVVEPEEELTDAEIEELKKSCVMIYAENENSQVQCSGVAIGENEYLTVYHAIADGRTSLKTSDGEKLTIGKTIPDIDIMALTSKNSVVPVNMGDIGESKSGDKIVIIGAPDGNNDTVTRTTINRIVGVIVIDGATVGGASGSAVFDMRGNLIGIVTGTSTESDASYAVTINTIKKSF